ncbi:uncharacterized protein LOC113550993 [Rhopalosiphum maidis]|uniref:uncharacterized protein LOC113550993 n=1 Tax=Rhopalosiphum maidis TaxID=43146 RepID=UPI000EFDEBBE|nr:uncharacterized protein LOC113550993 [Rhopalosiphum maidis]
MFLNRTMVTFALVISTAVLLGWYMRRKRKNNNDENRIDDQEPEDNLSVILKDNRFILFMIDGLILVGYFLRMLPIGLVAQLVLFALLAYTFHIVLSKCYAINVIWCQGIISINVDIDLKLFPKLRILKLFYLSGRTQ